MTKMELTKSMAKFLEMEIDGDHLRKDYKEGGGALFINLFSPIGFFAVWDKLDFANVKVEIAPYSTFSSHLYTCGFMTERVCFEKKGPDRYTAFYSAVHEMIKGDKE